MLINQSLKISKKCLYINDNKASIFTKEFLKLSDILQDDEYNKIYLNQYDDTYFHVYLDFDFIVFDINTGVSIYEDTTIEDLKNQFEKLSTKNYSDFKDNLNQRREQNQFINVAEIKLTEVAGEPIEYTQSLIQSRENFKKEREEKQVKEELKKQQDDEEFLNNNKNEIEELIKDAEQKIINNKEVINQDIKIYKSRYDYSETSLILYMMKLYKINLPIKTQGWVNKALVKIYFDEYSKKYNYSYYTSSKSSTVFNSYLSLLVEIVNDKYSNIV